MIRLSHGPRPQVLVKNGEAWTAEYVNWCANPVGTEPRGYGHSGIRKALEAETASKCAYCEDESAMSPIRTSNTSYRRVSTRSWSVTGRT